MLAGKHATHCDNTLTHNADHTLIGKIWTSSKLGMHYAKEARSKVTFYWRVHVHLQETVKVDISECSVPSIDARTLNLIAVHSRQWSSSNLRYAHIVLALMAKGLSALT